jgi:chemotaxis protein CheC
MSDPAAIVLDDMERDALTELVNLGVSRAGVSLRTMIGHEVLLSVPNVAIVTRGHAARMIGEHDDICLVAVSQSFEGDFSGRAMLIFPESNCLELVRAVVGGALSLDDVIALEQEALVETGNVILNSCLATIANMLRRHLNMSLPELLRGNGAVLFELSVPSASEEVVLLLYIDFSVNARDIKGYIALLMDMPTLRALKDLLRELIHRTAGDMPPAVPPAAAARFHVAP